MPELSEPRQRVVPQPLAYRWGGEFGPLPVRIILPRQPGQPMLPGLKAQPWLATGQPDQAFDFTGHIRRLCADIVRRSDELRHIDVSRLLFGVTQARNSRLLGLQARVTPLRFPRGQLMRQRRGVTYQVQRYFHGANEFLYLVTFCLPRFLDQPFDDKLITVFHELYHINPSFDGDLRRHHGRYCVHSHSQRHYDRRMAALAREYLAGRPDPALHAFLRLNFNQLANRHGSVKGVVVPLPKMVPVVLAAASRQKRFSGQRVVEEH
jgi:Putative phage metallopeptidase